MGKWINRDSFPGVKTCRIMPLGCILVLSMLDTDWKDQPVYMMDFEGSPSSGVVEYGVVKLYQGKIEMTRSEMCRPTGAILSRDRGVHGISEAEAAERKPFLEAFEQFVGYRRNGVFAAHNRHAENSFLKDTWAVPPVVPDWRSGTGSSQEWGPWIDTLSIYRSVYPHLQSYGLGSLVEAFELAEQLEELGHEHCPEHRCRAHCALYDAIASSLLLLRLEDVESLSGRISTGWLLACSQQTNPQAELF